eukprot:gene25896-biopygen15069
MPVDPWSAPMISVHPRARCHPAPSGDGRGHVRFFKLPHPARVRPCISLRRSSQKCGRSSPAVRSPAWRCHAIRRARTSSVFEPAPAVTWQACKMHHAVLRGPQDRSITKLATCHSSISP